MHAKLAKLNDCVISFLDRTAANFMGGDYSQNGGNRRCSKNFQTSKKKVVKNFWGNSQKKPEGGGKSWIRPGRQPP